MVSKFAILRNLCLLASAVLASPSSPHDAHLARQSEDDQLSGTTSYSANWAGAGWSVAAGAITYVKSDFRVPTAVAGGSSTTGSVWVGIDGWSCTAALFQTGVQASVTSNGQATYTAFYEWYPASSIVFNQPISISAGDHILAGVYVTSPTTGYAVVENWTTNQVVSQNVTSTTPLCLQDAEWIVEHYDQSGPFPFGPTTFFNAAAGGSGTTQYTTSGASTYEVSVNGKVLTAVSPSTPNGFTVTHS